MPIFFRERGRHSASKRSFERGLTMSDAANAGPWRSMTET
ncbi:hypothetical protein BURPS406E_G0206 [Burkholderia pseudomallei 406e]|nr:hypothetical protein BURPS406E_G0206 [Burkholderia pseudomallei 406e]